MPSPANTVAFKRMISTLWKVLGETPVEKKNSYFARFFTSLEALEGIATTAAPTFAPGLIELFDAPEAPTLARLKAIPTTVIDCWGVYLLILEKEGSPSKVYVGSGTNAEYSIPARFEAYEKMDHLPVYVEKAINDGYNITHKKLLCWTPSIPRPGKVPITRLLIVGLEGTLAYLFGAMRKVYGDWGMGHICPWGLDSLEYGGLCSHPCINEGIRGDFDLTEEQLEAKAAEDALKFRENHNKNNSNWHYHKMETDYHDYIDAAIARKMKSRELHPELDRIAEKARNERIVAEKKWYCSTCDKAFTRDTILATHMASKAHAAKVNGPKKTPWYCHLCNRYFCSSASLKRHRKENTVHKEKVKAAEAALKASS